MVYPTSMLSRDIGVFYDPRDVGLLAEPLRSRIYTAMRDAPTGGLVPVSLRRSPWQQYLLRRGRCPGREFNSICRGSPVTALPYRSNHQRGTAADMGGRDLWWLIAHEREYGLERTVSSENWHFEAVGTPTRRIIPYPGSTPAPDEEFRMDAEARKAFAELRSEINQLQSDVSAVKGGLMLTQAFLVKARDYWWIPSTRRGRLVMEKLGITDRK